MLILFPPFNTITNAPPNQVRAADKTPCKGGSLSAVIKMGGCIYDSPSFWGAIFAFLVH